MFKNINVYIVSIIFCLTMPGLASTFSIYLGEYGVKGISILLLFFGIKKIQKPFSYRFFTFIFSILMILFFYRFFNSTADAEAQLLPFLSTIWVVLLLLYMHSISHLVIFLKCLYSSCLIVLFSPGLNRIFDFSRLGYSVDRLENALIGIATHYIEYAMVAVISFYLSLFFLFIAKKNIYKILNLLLAITSITAVITSGSRGAIVATVLSLIFYTILLFKYSAKKFNSKLVFFLILTVFVFVYLFPWEKVFSAFLVIGSNQDKSSLQRLDLFQFSLNNFLDNPIFGVGWDYIKLVKGKRAHSLILQLLSELGIIGLLLEALVYFIIFKMIKSFKYLKVNSINQDTKFLLLTLFSIQSCFFVWCFFENLGFAFGTRFIYSNLACLILAFSLIRFNKNYS